MAHAGYLGPMTPRTGLSEEELLVAVQATGESRGSKVGWSNQRNMRTGAKMWSYGAKMWSYVTKRGIDPTKNWI